MQTPTVAVEAYISRLEQVERASRAADPIPPTALYLIPSIRKYLVACDIHAHRQAQVPA